jgi:putative addiction module killer protein
MLSSNKPIEVREYTDEQGKSPFGRWFDGLNAVAAAKVTLALEKIAKGNFSNVEPAGEGVSEYKLDWGPGYRIYFGKDGETLVILVGGGIKKRQSADIAKAHDIWAEYKKRKREEEKNKKEK